MNPKIGLAGFFIGLTGLLLTGYFGFVAGSSETKLELHNTSSIALAAPTGPLSDRIRIFLDEVEVQQLWLATFTLVNTGDTDIAPGDFGKPMIFTVSDIGFEELIPDEVGNNGPQAEFLLIDKTSFSLNPLLLKAGEAIAFSVVSSAKLTDIKVSARVKGLDLVPVIFTLREGTGDDTANRFLAIIAVVGGISVALVVLGLTSSILLFWRTLTYRIYTVGRSTDSPGESDGSPHVSPQPKSENPPFPVLSTVVDTLGNLVSSKGDYVSSGGVLRPGDIMEFECTVSSPDDSPCEFRLSEGTTHRDWTRSPNLRWEVRENDIGQNVTAMVYMRSNKAFHAHSTYDDSALFTYNVWPRQQPETDNAEEEPHDGQAKEGS